VLSTSWVTASGGTDDALWLFGGVTSGADNRAAASADHTDDPIALTTRSACSSELWRFDRAGRWTLVGDGSFVSRRDGSLAWPPETCGAHAVNYAGNFENAESVGLGVWMVGGWGPSAGGCQDGAARMQRTAVLPDQERQSGSPPPASTCDAHRVLWHGSLLQDSSGDKPPR